MRTLGIDLASQPERTAMATLDWSPAGATVIDVRTTVTDEMILDALRAADRTGIDAPFGWPDAFVDVVSAHHIYDSASENELFTEPGVTRFVRRMTDEWVRARTGLVPLSVSADRIAYVALRAVRLLARADDPGFDAGRVNGTAVEAYPAAALKIWGLSHNRYKGKTNHQVLARLIDDLCDLAPWLDFGPHRALCTVSDDAFDAVVTAMIARAAALGMTELPDAAGTLVAEREGWIHVPNQPLGALAPS
ncbi:DUF429 domain-containing protein [Williamsia sp. 1135]|uniref:DUF429 domain-containing protein n=1 Tax=Williamsia sp. 1135 TaxID=1889262 RepID=UPI000A10E889|nr:DUF429 domain-containing protein [Williamsia sp. 1135]ORM33424.1 hypothetical protein BFL43_13945 [Williamsia sp. 1135]